jgi:hypothetical protein
MQGVRILGFAWRYQIYAHVNVVNRSYALQGPGLFAQLQESRRGNVGGKHTLAAIPTQYRQLIWVGIRQGPQHRCIDQSEDNRVSGDAECKRNDNYAGKCLSSTQRTQCIANILKENTH